MKSNKKRILFVLAILTMALVLSCALVACDKVGTDKTGTDIVADYKVTIHPNNGQSDIVWDITKEIPTITKDGFHIAGYFLDAQLTMSTTLESLKATGLTNNIDIYVKWEEDVCEHVEVTDNAVAPTCTEKGLTEGTHCSKCGKILQAQTEIPALGHDLEHHGKKDATCTEPGWKEYVTCKREGCDHTTYKEIPALGHTGGTATCTEQATCERCNEKYGNPLGHNYGTLIPQTNATCSATGIRSHYKCSSCNKLFADDEHKTETTLDDLTIAINPNAHNFGEWRKNEGADTHTRVCSFNNEHTETENCLGGTATCIEKATCEKCNAKYGELANHDYKNGVCTVCGTRRISEGLEYSWNSGETGYTVTGIGTCTDTEIIIPSEYNAKPVTSIGYQAFQGCTGLTNITIGNSVTSIGNYAFVGCIGLTSIIVDEGNTKYHSAGNCLIETATKTLILGCKTSVIPADGSVTSIGNYAFRDCTGLTSVVIPDSVTSIGSYAFFNCTGLTSIIVDERNTKYHSAGNCLIETATKTLILGCKTSVIPTDGSVTSIDGGAFYGCTGLTSITIPDSVTRIGNGAFYYCTGLTSVTIPDSVTSIGNYAFSDCYRLVEVYNKSTLSITAGSSSNGYVAYYAKNVYTNEGGSKLTTDENGYVIYTDGDEKILVSYHGTNTELVLPSYITKINQNAFYYCTGLTSVTIPDSVTSIGERAFRDCTGLTSVAIGNSVTSIGEYAFSGCTGLTKIIGSSSPASVVAKQCGSKSFEVVITSVTNIGYEAFYRCTGLTSIVIPDSVTSIGNYAFYYCTGLTSITIPDSVTSIGDYAFYYCTGLMSIIVDEGNTKYHSAGNCLIETATKTLLLGCKTSVIPTDGSVTSIDGGAFYYCTGLTSVTIPDSVTSIGEYAFSGCTGLTKIIGSSSPASVVAKQCGSKSFEVVITSGTSIGGSAFEGCSGLTSIIIPDSVTNIGSSAFSGCSGLMNITIPNSVTSIGNGAFRDCTGLTSITIPDSVTSIGNYAFDYCYRLIEVYNKSTLSITAGSYDNGEVAYYAKNVYTNEGGSKLTTDENGYVIYTDGDEKILVAYHGTNTELVLPSYITKINQNAFSGCKGLTSITIPDSVTSIGDYAFYYCTGLKSVTIGNSVTSIGNYAFRGCTGLMSVTVADGNTKYHSSGNCLIETASKTLILGCNTSVIPNDGSVTSIGNYAFSGCTGLTSITIPDSVTSIGDSAFSGCTGLTSVTIGNGVTSIRSDAFFECTGLTSITFNGTIAQWNAISKGTFWKASVPATEVVCTDGKVSI